jgi:uncharacterized cupin superfamily protein
VSRSQGGVVHWDEVEGHDVDRHGKRARWTFLGDAAGTVSVGVTRLQIEPGCRPTPPHVHSAEEEIFWVLDGEGLSWQDGQTYAVRAGDCLVHLPGREAHTLRAGDAGLDVLAFGQRIDTESGYLPRGDVAWYGMSWVRTGDGEHPWKLDEDAGPLDFPEPSERPSRILRAEDVEPRVRERGESRIVDRNLGRAGGADLDLSLVELEPGRLGWPPHCHSADEELFVVLDGEGTLELRPTDGEPTTHAVRRGHVISRPPGTRVAHSFRAGDTGLRYLVYGPHDPNDIAYFPRSGKVYIRGVGIIGRIEPLDYWLGEE